MERNSIELNNAATEPSTENGENNGFVRDPKAGTAIGTLEIRDRIRELRRVPAKELVPNPKNWRRHPKAQAEALRGLLAEIGYADALLVRELPDGRLMLIDGHLRAETTPEAQVPVLVLDLSEEEADKLLLTLDPLAAMAESDAERITALLQTVRTDSEAVESLLRRTAGEQVWKIIHPEDTFEPPAQFDQAAELQKKWRQTQVNSGRSASIASCPAIRPRPRT